MTDCDFCETAFDTIERTVVAMPRPSQPDTITATMWGCGKCEESKNLPTAAAIIEAVEETGTWEGRRFLFHDV
jgi:hypothetical protein